LFTGLIEAVGRVESCSSGTLKISTELAEEAREGDSLSVDGSCLTVTSITGDILSFTCSRETVSRTVLSHYRAGTGVNLERPLRLDQGLHGHLVTGHVDEAAQILKIETLARGKTAWISCSGEGYALLVEKGSVAVSGISLTVAGLVPGRFSVAVIPETLNRTTAFEWKPGFRVNLEYDIIGKYVKKYADSALSSEGLRRYLEQ